jgi:hypothetical protein
MTAAAIDWLVHHCVMVELNAKLPRGADQEGSPSPEDAVRGAPSGAPPSFYVEFVGPGEIPRVFGRVISMTLLVRIDSGPPAKFVAFYQ